MNEPIANKDYVKAFLSFKQVKARKSLSQNFLIDDGIAKLITNQLDSSSPILEIGPGLGALTYHLVQKNTKIILVEIDPLMIEHLQNVFHLQNVDIISKDILQLNLEQFSEPFNVVANLPYNITTEIISKLLKTNTIKSMVLMVQKEAYFRLIGEKNNHSALSIFIDYWGGSKLICKVSRHAYIPEPHVDSVVFKIENKKPKPCQNEKLFYQVTHNMFLLRRKTILNNLSVYLKDKEKAKNILNTLNCPLNMRSEQLPLEFYLALTNLLDQKK